MLAAVKVPVSNHQERKRQRKHQRQLAEQHLQKMANTTFNRAVDSDSNNNNNTHNNTNTLPAKSKKRDYNKENTVNAKTLPQIQINTSDLDDEHSTLLGSDGNAISTSISNSNSSDSGGITTSTSTAEHNLTNKQIKAMI
jgi:hypothetical protein